MTVGKIGIFWAVVGMFASMAIAVTISVKASERAVERGERAALLSQCQEWHGQIAVYTETPPSTLPGRNMLAYYQSEYAAKCTKG